MTSPPSPKRSFTKPWLPCGQQVALLKSRGLAIPDEAAAAAFLSHVSYYRVSGFCLAFEEKRHAFLPGGTFDDIKSAYEFDVCLRDLINEALEVIEIDIRTWLANHLGQRYGAFGHTDPRTFFNRFDHAEWMEHIHDEVNRSSELFVNHFRRTYAEYPDLPAWVLMELVSFGTLTRMYRGMTRPDQRIVSKRYRLQPRDFAAILLHLAYVRNLCAHHLRLWDRVWSVKAILPKGRHWEPPLVPGNDRLFSTLVLTYHLLVNCPAIGDFPAQWRDRLRTLLLNPPKTPAALAAMGMPGNWQQHPMWG